MRVLIVEDEEQMVARLAEEISCLSPPVEVTIARSRSSGVAAIHSAEFELIVCDLRLPPEDGGVDTDEAHGLAVHAAIGDEMPGTPCLFFTGFGTSQAVVDELSSRGAYDIVGNGEEYGMTQLLTKDRFTECVDRIDALNQELVHLAAVDIVMDGSATHELDEVEGRTLRIAARLLKSPRVEVSPLSGGYSGAWTLKARFKDGQDRPRATYFSKIGLRDKLRAERENYDQYVYPLLRMGDYPALVRDVDAGVGRRRALFYQLADEYESSFFDVLRDSPDTTGSLVDDVRALFAPWRALDESAELRIHDLRSDRIDDAVVGSFDEDLPGRERFENIDQAATLSYQHGDLHGANVLYGANRRPLIVDFGNVQLAPACLDPVLLELSILFHIDSPYRSAAWPTIEQAEAWFELEDYLDGCPVADFVMRCRAWATETGAPAELPPVVYAEAVRQLKYADTDHGVALAIARAAIREGS